MDSNSVDTAPRRVILDFSIPSRYGIACAMLEAHKQMLDQEPQEPDGIYGAGYTMKNGDSFTATGKSVVNGVVITVRYEENLDLLLPNIRSRHPYNGEFREITPEEAYYKGVADGRREAYYTPMAFDLEPEEQAVAFGITPEEAWKFAQENSLSWRQERARRNGELIPKK